MSGFREYLNEAAGRKANITDSKGNKLLVDRNGDNLTMTLNGSKHTFSFNKEVTKLSSALSLGKDTEIKTNNGNIEFSTEKEYNKDGVIMTIANGDYFHFNDKLADKVLDTIASW